MHFLKDFPFLVPGEALLVPLTTIQGEGSIGTAQHPKRMNKKQRKTQLPKYFSWFLTDLTGFLTSLHSEGPVFGRSPPAQI